MLVRQFPMLKGLHRRCPRWPRYLHYSLMPTAWQGGEAKLLWHMRESDHDVLAGTRTTLTDTKCHIHGAENIPAS